MSNRRKQLSTGPFSPAMLVRRHPATFFFNDTATTEIYTLSYTLSLHDALPIRAAPNIACLQGLLSSWYQALMSSWMFSRSEEHTSELQSHSEISYAVFCLK